MNRETFHVIERVKSLGIAEQDAWQLRRISMTLQRWFELECGDSNNYCSWAIERDEETEKPFRVVHTHSQSGPNATRRYPIADKENGARKRLGKIMARYPKLSAYVQTDPRGAALYILKPGDVPKGEDVSGYYSRGVAVYK